MKRLNFLPSAVIVMLTLFSCNSGSDGKTTETTTDTTTTATTEKQPETPAAPRMTMLIKHKVANFNKWLPAYESHDSARVAHGLHNFVVGRGIKDSNMVLVALHMDDTAKAREFSMMPDLKTAMQKGGVLGAPKFTYRGKPLVRQHYQFIHQPGNNNPKSKRLGCMEKSFRQSQTGKNGCRPY